VRAGAVDALVAMAETVLSQGPRRARRGRMRVSFDEVTERMPKRGEERWISGRFSAR
jgi:hypothetical protein